ncbi:MAG: peptidoglycan-binding protein, partial [Acidobacteria bacterium]|nr:peptidoglycan-binding protein [Acidobacteriota bacterium]
MNNRFEFETFDEQPFVFEEEDEARSSRRRALPRRKPSSASKLVSRRKSPFKPPLIPGLKFPPRLPIRPLPVAVWPGFPPEPPQSPEPRKDSGSSGTPSTPPDNDTPHEGSEYLRWVQVSLNQLLRLNLRTDGVIDAGTRDAIRSFQQRENLPVTGVIGPDTQQALVAATRNQTQPTDQEFPWLPSIFPSLFPAQIEDRTAFGLKENRKGKPR